jgi:hypothetical protein
MRHQLPSLLVGLGLDRNKGVFGKHHGRERDDEERSKGGSAAAPTFPSPLIHLSTRTPRLHYALLLKCLC